MHPFVLRNDSGEEAIALDVVFSIRRGSLSLARLSTLDGTTIKHGKTGSDSRSLAVRGLKTRIRPGQSIRLDIDAPGEAVRLARVAWNPTDDGQPRDQVPAPSTDWETIAAWRESRAQRESDKFTARAIRFFNALDIQTILEARSLWKEVPEGDFERRREALEELPVELIAGLRARRNDGATRPYRGSEKLRPLADEISRVFAAAFAQAGGGTLDELASFFDIFARGGLVLTRPEDRDHRDYREYMLPSCQPDSANVFLFAEIADLCLATQGIKQGMWRAILPTLVYSQKLCYEAYNRNHEPIPWNRLIALEERQVVPRNYHEVRTMTLKATDLHQLWHANVRRRVAEPPRV